MADSFNKKERDKKKRKKKKDKAEKKRQNKLDGVKSAEFLYMDEDGNLTPVPPDPTKKKKVIKLEDIEISIPKKTEMTQSIKIRNGYVKFYDQEKRFGFIREENSRDDFFFHADSLAQPVKENDKVTYEMGSGPKGPVAIEVKLVKKEPKVEKPAVEEPKEEAEATATSEEAVTEVKEDAPE